MDGLFDSKGFSLLLRDRAFVFRYYNDVMEPSGVWAHFHDCYEMLWLIRGDCDYSVEGNIYTMNPMDLVFTNMRELHMPMFNSRVHHYERVNLLIKASFLSPFVTETYNPLALFENRPMGRHNKIDGEMVKRFGIDEYFVRIHKAMVADDRHTEPLVKSLLVQMLIQIEQCMSLSKTAYRNHDKVSAVLRHISKHLGEDLRYEALAELAYVSPNHLYRIFKQQTGFTLPEYIKYKRIARAKELLLDGATSMDAAQQVGFRDYSGFFRSFKGVTGVSPSEFIARTR